ncbi:MAG: hypothetical protein K2R98_19410 [Gemmataceae bacterium]|nr:hypothetical protein [Gemmataceae bacterium]
MTGIPVYYVESMADRVQVRFPRSKKRRIRRKWAKQAKNFRLVPRPDIIRVGNGLYAHPETWREFCKLYDIKEAAAERRFATVGAPGLAATTGGITLQSLSDSLALLSKVMPQAPDWQSPLSFQMPEPDLDKSWLYSCSPRFDFAPTPSRAFLCNTVF